VAARRKSARGAAAKADRPATHLHLEPFSGIAGNMFMGALLDLGLSRRALAADLAGLGVEFKLRVTKVRRGALAARYVDVLVPSPSGARGRTGRRKQVSDHDHGGHHGHAHGRSYVAIVRLLRAAKLEPQIRDRALAIFEALGVAEAHVHGIPLEKVHFHEVGAVDAIVDVTAAAAGLHRLGVERVTCTPVALGHGTVETDHGRLPLPAPATLELLKGVPTVPAHVAWETVTPTGAAILRCIVDEYRPLPAMTPQAVGHGAGKDREGPMPNLLRAVLGRSGGLDADRIVQLETNLDDLVPEHFDHLLERLLEAGALDVSIQHIQMKKNRPGFLVRVLARPADRLSLSQLLFAESTAIGVRCIEADRLMLQRELRKVTTPYGRIGVKVVFSPDGGAQVSAEYDDCKRAARRAKVALREVVRVAEEIARAQL
jgi:uncharacterized protein (TIGR00299 family) protein